MNRFRKAVILNPSAEGRQYNEPLCENGIRECSGKTHRGQRGVSDNYSNTSTFSDLSNSRRYNDAKDGLDIVLEFIEESLSRFIRNPYLYADKAMSMDPESTKNNTFSLVLVAFAKQWLYFKKNEQNLKRLELMTKFFFDFILVSVLIGESPKTLIALIEYMHDNASQDAQEELYTLKETMFGWLPEKVKYLPGTG